MTTKHTEPCESAAAERPRDGDRRTSIGEGRGRETRVPAQAAYLLDVARALREEACDG